SEEELLQLGIADLHPKESLEQVIAEFTAQSRGENPMSAAIPCLRKDGAVFYADVAGANTIIHGRRCTVGFFADVTERKRMEIELTRSENSLRLLLESTDQGIYGIDSEGLCNFINKAALQMLGYSIEEVSGVNMHILIHHSYPDGSPYPVAECPIFQVKETGHGVHVANEVLWRKDGSALPAEYSAYPIKESGKILGAVIAFYDITEQKQMMANMQRASEAAKVATRAKSDFLANMSHELRTPLNAILGFADLLHEGIAGTLNNEQKEYAGLIHRSGKHLLGLVNNILDLSKVEAGKMELELSRFPLITELGSAVLMVKGKAQKRGISIVVDAQPELEIEADERKLRQILFNLLGNAVKFTPNSGSIKVSARIISDGEANEQITFEAGRVSPSTTQFWEISVTDTGIGIREEDMPKLFQEFSQIGHPHTKEYEGTGLGLALTKKLVELHGGRIWARSEFGVGSTFSFSIPHKESADLHNGYNIRSL
ncbi:MAG: ATP-binding protein, partial [Deltaproteobacteria bacterium]